METLSYTDKDLVEKAKRKSKNPRRKIIKGLAALLLAVGTGTNSCVQNIIGGKNLTQTLNTYVPAWTIFRVPEKNKINFYCYQDDWTYGASATLRLRNLTLELTDYFIEENPRTNTSSKINFDF